MGYSYTTQKIKDFSMYSANRREYYQYRKMLQSCFKPRYPSYRTIGAAGISVFAPWTEPHYGFKSFFKHIGPMPESGCTLDRHDPDKDFLPGNVYWRLPEKQADIVDLAQQQQYA